MIPSAPADLSFGISSRTTCSSMIVSTATQPERLRAEMGGGEVRMELEEARVDALMRLETYTTGEGEEAGEGTEGAVEAA